jgi:glycosyltransferase involved in cell wall biosynthesis
VTHYIEQHQLPVRLTGFVENPGAYMGGTRIACVSGYLAILEAMIRRKPIATFYDTPIKEDYLRMAPYAKDIIIENPPTGLAEAISQELGKPSIDTEKNYRFAAGQTWEKLAKEYLELYQG